MTTADIIDGIIAKKNERGMSNQQLSDASRVPKPTIDRILRKDTPNPSMQTVLDLAAAVGYSFSNHPEHPPASPPEIGIRDPMVLHMINIYENRERSYEERIKRNTAHFNMLLAEKNRWLRMSLTMNIILIVFICGILIYDVTHPNVGWFRGMMEQFSGSSARNIVMLVKNWMGSFHLI